MTPSPSTVTILRRPSILDAVGSTPLLDLSRLAAWAGLRPTQRILAKAEHLNPGGSGKDRIAIALLDEAERRGLREGGIVVEATSGNTGISLAQACAVRGYRLHVVCSEKVSGEKIALLRALGAVVHKVPNVPHGHPQHYATKAPRLADELGGFLLGQFTSEANAAVHELVTGPEIGRQATAVGARIDAFVCGAGTGGTLLGVGRYLRRHHPHARIVLADPDGSRLAQEGPARPYLVEGIGDDEPPPLFSRARLDARVTVTDEDSFRYALAAARTEGLVVGGSAGCHLAACALVARGLGANAVVVTILPDSGRNYLSKFFDPQWCRAHGLGHLHEEASP